MTPEVERLCAFIRERQAIYLRRAEGAPKPWTTDPILRRYRFCNIYREQDTVTQWIKDNWRNPHSDEPDLWFAMLVARTFNWPNTLHYIGWPVPWRPKRVDAQVGKLLVQGAKVYTGAYVVPMNGRTGIKHKYLIESIFNPAWARRKDVRPRAGDSLADFNARLQTLFGLGGFNGAQVICDVKYARHSPLWVAHDWLTWAASGPGSRRGLNRVLGRAVAASWREAEWLAALTELRVEVNAALKKDKIELHAQDLQNVCCEWDKYLRVKLGQGRPRATYNGG
jgi:hypothetical protein